MFVEIEGPHSQQGDLVVFVCLSVSVCARVCVCKRQIKESMSAHDIEETHGQRRALIQFG